LKYLSDEDRTKFIEEMTPFLHEKAGATEKVNLDLEGHALRFRNQLEIIADTFNRLPDDTDFMPMLIVFNEYGHIAALGVTNMHDELTKNRTEEIILTLIEMGVDAVMFVSEAWIKTIKKGETLPAPISSYDDKEEVLHASYSYARGETYAYASIKRPHRQKPFIDTWLHGDAKGEEGRFTEFWGKVRQRHAENN
jgi:hypothetical protein